MAGVSAPGSVESVCSGVDHGDDRRSDPSDMPLMSGTGAGLRSRWLGTVAYQDGWSLQRGLHSDRANAGDDYLLTLEHPHVFTLGRNADPSHVLVDPVQVGAQLVRIDRGGDVTYHGPGQLVAYPILTLPKKGGGDSGLPDTGAYVRTLEQVLIETLDVLGVHGADRRRGYPGVWIEPDSPRARKIAAIGVRIEHGRSLHGVALNIAPDLDYFSHIVPCGIEDSGVTSVAAEGVNISMREAVEAFSQAFERYWKPAWVDHSDVIWRHSASDLSLFSRGEGPGEPTHGANAPRQGRPGSSPAASHNASHNGDGTSVRLMGRRAEAGVETAVAIGDRKPEWMRAPVHIGAEVLRLKRTVRDLGLITVCEEAGCPNLSECWSDGTATFMICGERCTRACGFCLVDTRHPMPPDPDEPVKVAQAVREMGVDFAVVTMVARDDLADGGSGQVAATIREIRRVGDNVRVEVLISDMKGDPTALETVFRERPDVLNHNVETVPRLQRAVRPSAGYARSLGVLARAREHDLVVKSGLVVGLGETEDEIVSTLADMAAVGASIVTIGQYLRPTSHHLPVAKWWTPGDFTRFKKIGESMGIGHVESSPFTRSSYHAKAGYEAEAISNTTSGRSHRQGDH